MMRSPTNISVHANNGDFRVTTFHSVSTIVRILHQIPVRSGQCPLFDLALVMGDWPHGTRHRLSILGGLLPVEGELADNFSVNVYKIFRIFFARKLRPPKYRIPFTRLFFLGPDTRGPRRSIYKRDSPVGGGSVTRL